MKVSRPSVYPFSRFPIGSLDQAEDLTSVVVVPVLQVVDAILALCFQAPAKYFLAAVNPFFRPIDVAWTRR